MVLNHELAEKFMFVSACSFWLP